MPSLNKCVRINKRDYFLFGTVSNSCTDLIISPEQAFMCVKVLTARVLRFDARPVLLRELLCAGRRAAHADRTARALSALKTSSLQF